MSIRDRIIRLIEQDNKISVPVTEETNLYLDLHFDSLTFVCLLLDVEGQYGITIELPEMEECLTVGRFIEIVETKVRGEVSYG